jgi:hypothetical protein
MTALVLVIFTSFALVLGSSRKLIPVFAAA